jgi:hypothetical protein
MTEKKTRISKSIPKLIQGLRRFDNYVAVSGLVMFSMVIGSAYFATKIAKNEIELPPNIRSPSLAVLLFVFSFAWIIWFIHLRRLEFKRGLRCPHCAGKLNRRFLIATWTCNRCRQIVIPETDETFPKASK